jgi:glycosyl hydrolase family 113
MIGKKIWIIAPALYIAVMLGACWHGDSVGATAEAPPVVVHSLSGLRPYCGVAIQLQRVDWVLLYKKLIDHVAADGADTVSLVVDARQENFQSQFMYMDVRKTMSDAQLTEIIDYAKARHMRVILMPIVLLDDPNDAHWRGTLDPKDWHEWFENYRDLLTHYAHIAQDHNVDLLVVGSELVTSEEHVDEWIETIKDVRQIFKGQLTYSSNWDRYWKIKFWKYLDVIGMNSYWTLGDDQNVTVDQIKSNWRQIQSDMFKFLDQQGKPVILLEAGWCSLQNAAKDSWDYTQTQLPADDELQKKLYEGFFESWWGQPRLAGFVMWSMDPGGDPSGQGYTPQGKPAEDVMRHWLSQPRWDIMVSK